MPFITQLIRKLSLQPRTKAWGGGLFVYRDAQSELSLTFRWDGAGLSSSGDIILFEEEKPTFQAVHIHGHLSRLLLMIRAGEPVTKLIWIVPDRWYSELDRIVFPYVRMWENSLGIRFPSIEYRNENGACLGSLGVSKGKRVRRINATARHVGGKLLTHRGEASMGCCCCGCCGPGCCTSDRPTEKPQTS